MRGYVDDLDALLADLHDDRITVLADVAVGAGVRVSPHRRPRR
jgi:hypothetical protein